MTAAAVITAQKETVNDGITPKSDDGQNYIAKNWVELDLSIFQLCWRTFIYKEIVWMGIYYDYIAIINTT